MMKLKNIIILCFVLTMGTTSHAQSYKVLGNDTINTIDKKGKKQGRWMEYEKLNNVIGNYKDNKREGVWRTYNYNGELDEENTYEKGKKIKSNNSKIRRIRASFGDGEVFKTKNHFDLNFYFIDYSKEAGKIEFSGVNIAIYELKFSKYELISELNSGEFSYIKNISLQPNKEYKIYFSLQGYLSRQYFVDTHLTNPNDSIYDFTNTYNVGFYRKYNKKLTPEALKLPSDIIKYSKNTKNLYADWRYNIYVNDKFNSLDKATQEKLITELDNTNNTEIQGLQEQKKKQDAEITKLNSEKLLKESEARANKLEAQQKEKELELISKEKLLQEFKIKEQQLEASQKAKEINLLNQNQLISELKLSGQELEIRQQNIEAEKKKQELKTSKLEQYKKTEEVKKEKMIRNLSLVGLLIVLGLVFFVYRSLRQNRKAKAIIENQKQIVESQKQLVEEKHKEITDSINYAERIQRSCLATKELLDENLKNYFVFFQPKDVVSGDFYWGSKLSNGNFALVTADSTGHGVPGAIMSLLNITSLEKAIEQHIQPAEILNVTRKIIIERLKKDGSLDGGKDGMDASLISLDFKNQKLIYSAANNPVWIVRKNQLIELKPDKMPIGKHDKDSELFTQHEFDLLKGDVVYTLTDGMPDQFGGPKGKKYMYKQLKELLISISIESMNAQRDTIAKALASWKGNLEQVDDICIIGIRI